MAVAGTATADILDYGVFGGAELSVGSNVNMLGVNRIGSNGNVDLSGGGNYQNVSGGGTVSLGNNVTVLGAVIANGAASVGGSSNIGGDVHSGGNVTSGNNVTFSSSIYAAGSIILGGGTTVGGTQNPAATPPALLSHATETVPASSVFAAGVANTHVSGGGSQVFAPGSYGNLTTGNNTDLFFSSGVYYFNSIGIGGGSDIHFDLTGGAITINVVGDFDTGNNVEFLLSGGDASGIFIEVLGDIDLNGGGTYHGTFFAGGGDIRLGSNVTLTGALYASGEVRVNGGSTINFQLAHNLPDQFPLDNGNGNGNGVTPIPEPASIALWGLLGLGAAGYYRRRQQRQAA